MITQKYVGWISRDVQTVLTVLMRVWKKRGNCRQLVCVGYTSYLLNGLPWQILVWHEAQCHFCCLLFNSSFNQRRMVVCLFLETFNIALHLIIIINSLNISPDATILTTVMDMKLLHTYGLALGNKKFS